ncbi:MAG TPA: carboxypeptidase-like regulatory domain-containing protein [Solirubrobacteraceae bacterium]|nr:carboxypeptidase-like regulatory domain-containing protein [Solirubrobacteraceae bacterium]
MGHPGSTWKTMRGILKGTCVAALASLALASGAEAGEYHVYSCRTPSGESAPTDGWSGSVEGAFDVYAEDTCPTGGALVAALGDQTTHIVNTDLATWTFSAPTADAIKDATLWRAGDADGGVVTNATYEFWLAGSSENDVFDECAFQFGCTKEVGNTGQPLSAVNRLSVPSANLGSNLYLNVACAGKTKSECPDAHGDLKEYAAVVYLYAADIVLEQSAGPTAGNVGGELASAPAVSGMSDVTFDASDPGAGVWETVFSVDGKVVQSTVPDEDGGLCRDVGQTTDGLPAFLYLQPCPQTESVDVPFDTAAVDNGAHHLVVSVVDPAGNSAPVLDREIDVDNPVPPRPNPPNGTNASSGATLTARWASTTKADLTSGWGKTEAITGRLTAPGGVPIGGASIDLTATPAYTGAKAVTPASPRTDADGRFELRLGRGESSRALTFAYRAHIGDTLPVATRTLKLGVRAGVTLSVAPRTASVGRSIFFKGVLEGTPLPAGGKQLVLEARSPGGEWIEFDVIHTAAHGRFRASYRFKFPGPARYQFRVLSKHEADFPFLEGSSNVVGVRER